MAQILDVLPPGIESFRREHWIRLKATSDLRRSREIRRALSRPPSAFGLSGCIDPPGVV